MNKEMDLKQFKEYCEKNDYNVVKHWSREHFDIICMKCRSKDTVIVFKEEEGAMGSEYTGYMRAFNGENGLIVKCRKCGNAMNIEMSPYEGTDGILKKEVKK